MPLTSSPHTGSVNKDLLGKAMLKTESIGDSTLEQLVAVQVEDEDEIFSINFDKATDAGLFTEAELDLLEKSLTTKSHYKKLLINEHALLFGKRKPGPLRSDFRKKLLGKFFVIIDILRLNKINIRNSVKIICILFCRIG